MPENKKTRPAAGTAERAVEMMACGASSSDFYSTSAVSDRQQKIYDRLGCGADEGKTLTQLAQETGMDPRELRRKIARERKAGNLIMSDNRHGYFRPSSEYDVQRFIRSMAHRAKEIAVISRAAEDVLASMSSQERLGGW